MSKRLRRFTRQQVVAMLRIIVEDDCGGESEAEESDALDFELCYSDDMSDNEETKPFDNTIPIVHLDDYKLLILTLKPIMLHVLMMILVWVLLKF